jgi:integrase
VTADIRAMVAAQPDTLLGLRNRAMLLVGFAGALRRPELSGLDVADCAFGHDGLVITLRFSKTDQQGEGQRLGIPYGGNPDTCPVRTLRRWISTAGLTEGPLFREIGPGGEVVAPYLDRRGRKRGGRLGDRSIALAVQASARAAGLATARNGGVGHTGASYLRCLACAWPAFRGTEISPEHQRILRRS